MIIRTEIARYLMIPVVMLLLAMLMLPVSATDTHATSALTPADILQNQSATPEIARASPASSDDTDFDRPLMHFTSEELSEFAAYQETMAMATAYEGEPLPPANKSLIAAVPYLGKDRDQGHCGNCWVWASTGALEVAHSINNNVSDRLSVQFFDSNWNNGSAVGNACDGGWPYQVAESYNNILKQAIPWSNTNAGYADYYWKPGNTSGMPASSIAPSPNYPVGTVRDTVLDTFNGSTGAIQNIKAEINAGIPVIYTFYLPETGWNNFFTFWKNESESEVWNPDPYAGGEIGGGHAVLIVGYDDTGSSPYWTVLNSWGTNALRPDGLFMLKMDMDYNGSAIENGTTYYANNFEIFNTEYLPPEPASGNLTVSSKPSAASIWIDGINTGYQTPAMIRQIPSGEHRLKLVKPGYFEYTRAVTIQPDETTPVSIPLTAIGALSVSSYPSGAAIWIDGTDTAKTTNASFMPLRPGDHELMLKKAGFDDYSTEFTVWGGKTTTLQGELNQTG